MRTPVCIVGGGPAGLLLCQLLRVAGIDSVVLERRSRSHVEGRIRAGVLEAGTVDLLEQAGAARRLHQDGLLHGGFSFGANGDRIRIDLRHLTGSAVTVYGQTEVTKDLIDAIRARDGRLVFGAEDATLHGIDGDAPVVTYAKDGRTHRVECDFIAGCDGFHGVSRAAMPDDVRRVYERVYPFGWLGILADVPPCDPELIYASHDRGFALASMRSASRSRYYLQVPLDADVTGWEDSRIWDELAMRLGPAAAAMVRGPSIEKSIAPLRSFVCEPMQWGRLFLAGDAAHIVPPTGAKGLNLAMSDAGLLSRALIAFYRHGQTSGLDGYSAAALARVWKAERFSWWFTGLTHRFPDMDSFARKIQRAEIDYIRTSRAAQTVIAENYVGLKQGGDPAGERMPYALTLPA